ncbi:MAG TPA: PLP-dependent aminotransferase family protein [Humisphaera sp.]
MAHPMTDGALPIPVPLGWSGKAKRTKEQPISFLIAEAFRNPRLINLAAGLVDPYSLPVAETRRIADAILSDTDRGRRALQYDTTAGLADLRRLCHRHLASLEGVAPESLPYSPDDMIVTTGSQQALYLIGDLLADPGDIVIAANPSYFVYTGTLQSLGAHVMAVPMDDGGMDVGAVAALLERLDREGRIDRVKFVYCTSYFDNPTGLSLAPDRRPKLLELVKRYSRRHRILILEDAAYRELRYDGPAVRSIKSYDERNEFVATSYTFSKPFSPGLKLGYTAMPKDLAHAMLQQKGNHDFGSSSLAMHIAATAMADGTYAAQVEKLRATYRAKRDRTLAALDRAFGAETRGGAAGPRVTYTRPDGGLYVWVTLPDGLDASRTGPLFAAALEAGVLYVPGDYCFQPDERGHVPTNHLRLCFGQLHPDQIEPGIERLAAAIARVAGPAPAAAAHAEPAGVAR